MSTHCLLSSARLFEVAILSPNHGRKSELRLHPSWQRSVVRKTSALSMARVVVEAVADMVVGPNSSDSKVVADQDLEEGIVHAERVDLNQNLEAR